MTLRRGRGGEVRQCAGCGADTRNLKFCTNACQALKTWNDALQLALGTGEMPSNSGRAKKILTHLRGRACEICSRTEWRGQPAPLILDHIDGNSDRHVLSNVRLVCGNCDMQLPTYKAKNKGNGRKARRDRYAAGLSY